MAGQNFISDYGPVGLYVHVPFCAAKCPYCGFYSEPIANHDYPRVVSAMIREIDRYDISGIETVYIGGGSPSILPIDELWRFIKEIKASAGSVKEFTVEVNPGQVDASFLAYLYSAGVNRLSIGAQSFNDNELIFLGRTHSADSIIEAVKNAKKAGFENISLDLIFAIPGSTVESFRHSLTAAISLGVQHISAYALTYEPQTPLSRAFSYGIFEPVDEETDRAMYELAIDLLTGAGIEQYEISNFARKGFQCRHNLLYWANKPYLGVGPGAASYLQRLRRTNIADIKKYTIAVENCENTIAESETLTPEEFACETAVLNLRTIQGIELTEFHKQTGFDAAELFAEVIESNTKSGSMEISQGRLFLTRQALPIADSVLCDFAAV